MPASRHSSSFWGSYARWNSEISRILSGVLDRFATKIDSLNDLNHHDLSFFFFHESYDWLRKRGSLLVFVSKVNKHWVKWTVNCPSFISKTFFEYLKGFSVHLQTHCCVVFLSPVASALGNISRFSVNTWYACYANQLARLVHSISTSIILCYLIGKLFSRYECTPIEKYVFHIKLLR